MFLLRLALSVHEQECIGSGVLSGIVGWFEVSFPGGIILSTSPEHQPLGDEGFNTHWRQTQFFLNEGRSVSCFVPVCMHRGQPALLRQVEQGDAVQLTLSMRKSAKNRRFVEYSLQLRVNDEALPPQDYLLA